MELSEGSENCIGPFLLVMRIFAVVFGELLLNFSLWFFLILLINPPAAVGAFYYFNSLTNPINQPSIPGTKYHLSLLPVRIVHKRTTPES